jgi:flagellar hook protein FlgE
MGSSLMTAVSGLQGHQRMLDVAGNNLANVNSYGFKSSRVTFAELLAETIQEATQPGGGMGGTNPKQVGSGMTVATIDRDISQGTLVQTGQALDMAIEGAGFFVLSDGTKDVYSRVGRFSVDSDYYLVDPGTGYRVQRLGTVGVTEGFQTAGSDDIRIPYDVALPARATENVSFTGNLSADNQAPTTNEMSSGMQYTEGGALAARETLIADLDQATGIVDGETITVAGKDRDGTDVSTTFTIGTGAGQDGETLGDLIDFISAAFTGATGRMSNGELRLRDDTAGYSQTDLYLTYNGAGTLELPYFFRHLAAGGAEVKTANVEIFDTLGIGHVVSAAFVRTDTANTWDMVVTDITGDVSFDSPDDRRVRGITFNPDGSFAGMGGAVPDTQTIVCRFGGPGATQWSINTGFGTIGQFDGLSQFGGASTVAASGQDGYEAGYLASLAVSRDGILSGMFTNGVRQNIAALQIATFQNPAGLLSAGQSYYEASANSGDPRVATALAGGAGAINAGTLERSNVDTAEEFVNLIQAQNGFQANARTITITNDMLRELSNMIR